MNRKKSPPILSCKYYDEASIFRPENLLREARRQKNIPKCKVPETCVLDPDGDIIRYLKAKGQTVKNKCWACYHSELYNVNLNGETIGVIPCAVGASYAVIVAEQLFVSGCKLLISVTSAGVVNESSFKKRFALITEAVRDEGTSYHYLPSDKPAGISGHLLEQLQLTSKQDNVSFFEAKSWTTDAPYRETPSAIEIYENRNITCVEMEAAALYAFAEARQHDVVCFAHLTNSMAQVEGDFEKGEAFGSVDTLKLISEVLRHLKVN